MFGQINRITTLPGRRDDVLRLVLTGTDAMPGCRSFIAAADAKDADVLWVTEIWDSAAHHAASLDQPAIRAAIGEARPLITGFETTAMLTPTPGPAWKPEGYPAMSPYLICPEAEALIGFVAAAFGGVLLRRFDRPDGSLMHAEMRIDDSVLMIGGGATAARAEGAHLHLYVPDVAAAFARALAAGATAVQEPRRKTSDDDLRGGVRDPFGTTWWLAAQ